MTDLLKVSLNNGIPVTGTGDVATINALMQDGGLRTIGNQTDVAATATDATPISGISIWKQISSSIQTLVAKWPTALGAGGGIKIDGSGISVPVSIAAVPPHDVSNAGTFAVQQVSGKAAIVTFTCGTTTYSANDVVGPGSGAAALTFGGVAASQGEIMITSVELRIDRGTLATETSYVLHLFNVTPPSALADSAALAMTTADRTAYLGSIAIPAVTNYTVFQYSSADNLNKQIKVLSTAVYGYLVSVGTITSPTAALYTITLHSRTV